MPEPMEPRVPLTPGGAWPRALVRLELLSDMPLEHAVFELAATSRRIRQGVISTFWGRDLVVWPSDRCEDVARAFRSTGAQPSTIFRATA